MTHGGQFPPSPEDRDRAHRAWPDDKPGMAGPAVLVAVVLAMAVVAVAAVVVAAVLLL